MGIPSFKVSSYLKAGIKAGLRSLGVEIRRIRPHEQDLSRSIGDIYRFLQDIKARGFAPRGIIDVGANNGNWTRLALSVYPSTPCLLIEPQDEMRDHLMALVTENAGCHYIKAGAGRTPGELIQTIWDDLAGSSFLPAINEEALRASKQRSTKIITIDGILARPYRDFHPDLVKLDIQGFELEALKGAETLFGRTEVFIVETSLFEFMPQMPIAREVFCFMSDRGYEIYDITGYLRRPYDESLGQVDFAFVKAKGVFRSSNEW
jgi:FkbM family methyltransferase